MTTSERRGLIARRTIRSERVRRFAGAAPDALGRSARYGGQAGGVARTPPAFFFLLRGRVCRLAAEQLAKEPGCRGQRYDEDLLQPNQGGEQHLEEPCLRGDAPGDQRGNAVFGDLVGTRDEVGVAVPLVRSEERRVGKECRSRWSPYH